MCNDQPNLNDHDFPNPGYLIVPSGYQRLNIRDGVTAETQFILAEENDFVLDHADDFETVASSNDKDTDVRFTYDNLGRKHYQSLSARPSLIVLRSCKFDCSSAETHVNDLLPVLLAQKNAGKSIVFLKVDNGSDWNLLLLVNELYFCRLFRETELDVLRIVSYTAKWSAYNNIEHLWSPMSRKLANVYLLLKLPGEAREPYKQSEDEEWICFVCK